MKLFIDIGHPAHVHYFRNFIKIMEQKGHTIMISARDKEVSHQLLEKYNLPFISRGKGKNGAIGKLIYMLKADYLIYKQAKKFRPDFFLSFVSPYAAQVSWFMRKPHIAFDDTEHAGIARKFYKPFTEIIFTPASFYKDLGSKQIRFNSFMELNYLHPLYFKPDSSVYDLLNISPAQPYILLRFVSWNANHDIGQFGLDLATKRVLIEELKTRYKIFVSAEGTLPADMEQYRIKIPVHKMHDVLAFADLFIGEGATMASECAMIGTPAVYVNSLNAGTLKEQERLGLIFGFRNSTGVFEKVKELINNKELKKEISQNKDKMLQQVIDPTKMMVDFFENYPGAGKK